MTTIETSLHSEAHAELPETRGPCREEHFLTLAPPILSELSKTVSTGVRGATRSAAVRFPLP